VGHLGLEPRTHGFKEGRLAAPDVLPAQIPRENTRNAHIAQGYGGCSSHESFHGYQAEDRGIVTERSRSPRCSDLAPRLPAALRPARTFRPAEFEHAYYSQNADRAEAG
jgi:hypothetical protein